MEYSSKTLLILPFKDTLMVSNGGQDPLTNNHNKANRSPQNMKFAYDFRTTNTGNEKSLSDYPVFGREVIAPGDGSIIQIIDGAIDVNPGEQDRGNGYGNTIVIDHQNGEYSVLCHFQFNTICVAVGTVVKRGQKLGLCGNTGNTSQPHIHFHLQNNPRLHLGDALPAQFKQILVNGEIKTNYEPIRGENVSNIIND